MTAPMRCTTTRRGVPKRWTLNLLTLQMMVQSGVVRRADFGPPSFGSRTRFHVVDDVDQNAVKEMASEQGWLARLLMGRRSQFSISKRS
jgi:hypothetical protein